MADFRYYTVSIKGLLPGMLMSNGQMADGANWYAQRLKELSGKHAAGEEVERQAIRFSITGRLYVDSDKRIVIPAEMFSSSLRKGASLLNMKKGRAWWGGVTVLTDAILIVDGLPAWDELHEHPEFVHRIMARNADKSAAPRYRPHFKNWSADVSIEIDPGSVDKNTAESIFKSTGKSVGLGDWRPSSPKNPGKFGRFQVLNIVEVEQPFSLAA
jgi:hypothetical protein